MELYEAISENFNSGALEELCFKLKVEYEDLRGSTRKLKALSLQEYMRTRSQTNQLLLALKEEKPAMQLEPYLYLVIQEVYPSEAQLAQLFQSFGLQIRDFGGPERLSWGSLEWRKDKAQKLQTYMAENGRLPELLAAVQQKGVDLSFFNSTAVNHPKDDPVLPANPPVAGPLPDEYMNFDLNISKIDGQYQIEVSDSPNGQEKAVTTFDLEDTDLRDKLTYLAKLRARPTDVEEVGDKLAQFLFPSKISHHLDLSLREAQKNQKNLRLRLRLGLDQPDLSRIPWEYCRINRKFVAQGIETPVVRYLKTNQPDYHPITVERPVRLLLITASPVDDKWKQLEVGKEAEAVKTAVQPLIDSGKVIVQVVDHASPTDLVTSVRRTFKPHILHFIGHGTLQENGEGALVLEDGSDEHKPRLVDVDDISQLLDATAVSLVILSACETAAHDTSEAIMGIAPRLVWDGMPAVIAMQYAVPDRTAGLFAKELYTFLTDYYPLDKAVTEARITTYFTSQDKAYWGIPVLFMRAPDGRLWQP
ncbi:MAG: CHAT domain-containing protein [Ardenticatenaceae bacterium]|nr:CHAT domain-containing protein [Ardenticatenaceae bacterium]